MLGRVGSGAGGGFNGELLGWRGSGYVRGKHEGLPVECLSGASTLAPTLTMVDWVNVATVVDVVALQEVGRR